MKRSFIPKSNSKLINLITIIAVDACLGAGQVIRKAYLSGNFKADSIARSDIKLDLDRKSENIIKRIISNRRPMDGIIAEESGSSNFEAEALWIIDPLDGTVNFAHGYQRFCVTVAWVLENQITVGVIYDPINNELFVALKNEGAFLNGKPIAVSTTPSLDLALFATGFGNRTSEDPNLVKFGAIKNIAQRVRIGGSSTLDLAYMACGRLDAYYEANLYLWDVAAGALLLEEAGGHCPLWQVKSPFGRTCLATNNKLFKASLTLLNLDNNLKCTNFR